MAGVLTRFEPGDDLSVVGVRSPCPPLGSVAEMAKAPGCKPADPF